MRRIWLISTLIVLGCASSPSKQDTPPAPPPVTHHAPAPENTVTQDNPNADPDAPRPNGVMLGTHPVQPVHKGYEELNQALSTASPEERPTLHFAIATLYIEHAFQEEMAAWELYDQAMEIEAQDPQKARELIATSDKRRQEVQDIVWSGDQHLLHIIDETPRAPEAHQALYLLASHALERRDFSAAQRLFQQLVAQYPDSPLVPESHLALGEVAFDEGKLEDAYTQYNTIITQYPDHDTVPYALYKRSWVEFNQKQWPAALATSETLIARIDQDPSKLKGLRHEALIDVPLFYGYWPDSDPKAAQATFTKLTQDPKELENMLRRLSEHYHDLGRDEDAKLLNSNP